MVMKKPNKILVIIALSMIAPSAYSGSLNDGIAAGDVLSSVLLNNAKAAINDNDSRTTALEKINNDIGNKISALEDADSVVDGKLTRLGDKDGDVADEILRLNVLDLDYEVRLDVLEAVDNDFTTRVTNLETGTNNNTSAVGTLQSADNAISTRIDDSVDSVNNLVTQAGAIIARVDAIDDTNNGTVKVLQDADNAISTRIGLIDDATTGTVKALQDADSDIGDRIGLIDDATNGTVKVLQDADNTISTRIGLIDDATNGTVKALEQEKDDLLNRVASMDGGKSATMPASLGNPFDNLVSDVVNLKNADTNISTRIGLIDNTANGTVKVLQDADNTISTRIDLIDDATTGTVKALQDADSDISTRIGLIDDATTGTVKALQDRVLNIDDATTGTVKALQDADNTIGDRIGDIDGANGTVNVLKAQLEADDIVIDNRISTLIGTDAYNANTPVTDTLAQIRKRVGALDGQSDCGTNVPASACEGSVATVDGRVDALPQHVFFPNASPAQGTATSDVWPVGSTFTRQSTGEIWMATELYENSSYVYWAPIAAGLRYEVGDVGPGGGWVYRVSADGFSGSEAYKLEPTLAQFAVKPVRYPFYYTNTSKHLSLTNTWALVALGGRAAGYCNQVASGVGRDPLGHWFLPSFSELIVMLGELGPRSPPVGTSIEEIKSGDYLSSSMLAQSFNQVYAADASITGGGAITVSAKAVDSVSGASLVRCGRHF
jgi:hypothetical protein